MNILFLHYATPASNSLNHIGQFAGALNDRGHACLVAVAGHSGTEMFPCPARQVSHAELLALPPARWFPDGRPADIVHAWTPREPVRRVLDSLPWHEATRLVIHLEDNEDQLLAAFTGRAPADLRGLPDEALAGLVNPALSHPRLWRALLWRADAATVITPRLLEFVPDDTPSHVLVPGIPAGFGPAEPDAPLRASIGIGTGDRVLVYTGGNTVPNQPELRELYLAVHRMNRNGRGVVLVRTGPGNADFDRDLGPEVLSRVRDLGIVSRERIPGLLALADVLVQPGAPGPFNDYRLPSKLPEFLASGRPVVLPASNLALELVEDTHALLLRTGDAEEIARQCIRVLDDPALARRLGAAGHAFAATHFDIRRSARMLEEFYSGVLATQRPAALRALPTAAWEHAARRLSTPRGGPKLEPLEAPFADSPVLDFFALQQAWHQRLLNAEALWRSATPPLPAPATPAPRASVPPRMLPPAARTPPPAPEPAEILLSAGAEPPRFSVLMPVFNPEPSVLRAAIQSVRAQTWPEWELCIADDASTRPGVDAVLREAAASDTRIRVHRRERNGHISAASNSALEQARHPWIALLDHDDLLAPAALAHAARSIAANPALWWMYSDEDKIAPDGSFQDPYWKPSWSPDLLLGHHYGAHLSVFSTERVRAVGGFREGLEGAQDWDLALRVTRGADPSRIGHLPAVLYHWRITETSTAGGPGAKDYAVLAALRAVQEHATATEPGATALPGPSAGSIRVRHPLPARTRIALITAIPDTPGPISGRLSTLLARTGHRDALLIAVEHGELPVETERAVSALPFPERTRRVRRSDRAGGAALLNTGAASAEGFDVLVFIDPALVPLDPEWLDELASQALREGVGACGARILHEPSGTIEHAGFALSDPQLGRSLYAGHALGTCEWNGRPQIVTNPRAVTSACLAIRRDRFLKVGGFNEGYPDVAADIDLCLRLVESGLRTVHTPFARLWSPGLTREPVAASVEAHLRAHWARYFDEP